MSANTIFKCLKSNCKKSCCGPFSGVSFELISLDKRPFSEIILTEEDSHTLIMNGFEHLFERVFSKKHGKHYHRMITAPDGECIAYEREKCSIYSIRPTLCKAFPFYIDVFAGLCVVKCPGVDVSNDDTNDCKPYIDAARKMYAFWLNFYDDYR